MCQHSHAAVKHWTLTSAVDLYVGIACTLLNCKNPLFYIICCHVSKSHEETLEICNHTLASLKLLFLLLQWSFVFCYLYTNSCLWSYVIYIFLLQPLLSNLWLSSWTGPYRKTTWILQTLPTSSSRTWGRVTCPMQHWNVTTHWRSSSNHTQRTGLAYSRWITLSRFTTLSFFKSNQHVFSCVL